MLCVTNQANGAGKQPVDVDDEDARKLLALHGSAKGGPSWRVTGGVRRVDAKVDGEAIRTHESPRSSRAVDIGDGAGGQEIRRDRIRRAN